MKSMKAAGIAILCMLLVTLPTTGCTASQAQVNTAVQDIANWTPVVTSDATALLTDIASFDAADAAAIERFVSTMQQDSATLTSLCNSYLVTPSSSLLSQISQNISSIAASNSSALLALLQIKNPNSQAVAKGVLTTIATAMTIMSGYLATANVKVTPATTAALQEMRPYVDRSKLQAELQVAKDQGLAPRDATLSAFGF